MSYNNLPPQAYTKEMLTEAFQWLQHQPDQVRQSVTSPDSLVSLYRRSQKMGGPEVKEAPSTKSFKQELKNLAQEFKQFEEPRPTSPPQNLDWVSAPAASVPPQQPSVSFAPPQASFVVPPAPTIAVPAVSGIPQLDERSLESVRRCMRTMNLGSEAEALRALISLGDQQLKNIFP